MVASRGVVAHLMCAQNRQQAKRKWPTQPDLAQQVLPGKIVVVGGADKQGGKDREDEQDQAHDPAGGPRREDGRHSNENGLPAFFAEQRRIAVALETAAQLVVTIDRRTNKLPAKADIFVLGLVVSSLQGQEKAIKLLAERSDDS